MSHEIRTPMNGIVGVIDLLQKTKLDKEQNDLLNIVNKSSFHLITIINDILDISKLEAGKMKLHHEVFSVKDFAEQVKSLFSAKLREKNLNFSVNIKDDVPNNIVTDRTRMVQVVTNLVSNAIKFTDDGSVKINISSLVKTIKTTLFLKWKSLILVLVSIRNQKNYYLNHLVN